MGSTRATAVIGLWTTTVWGFAGVALTREVVSTSRAADVVAASPLCSTACPALGAGPTWVAVAVLSAWGIIALGSLVALVVLLVGQASTRT